MGNFFSRRMGNRFPHRNFCIASFAVDEFTHAINTGDYNEGIFILTKIANSTHTNTEHIEGLMSMIYILHSTNDNKIAAEKLKKLLQRQQVRQQERPQVQQQERPQVQQHPQEPYKRCEPQRVLLTPPPRPRLTAQSLAQATTLAEATPDPELDGLDYYKGLNPNDFSIPGSIRGTHA